MKFLKIAIALLVLVCVKSDVPAIEDAQVDQVGQVLEENDRLLDEEDSYDPYKNDLEGLMFMRSLNIDLRQGSCTNPLVNKLKPCARCNADNTCSNGGTCCPKIVTKIRKKKKGKTCKQMNKNCVKLKPNLPAAPNSVKQCICGNVRQCCTNRGNVATTSTTGASVTTATSTTTPRTTTVGSTIRATTTTTGAAITTTGAALTMTGTTTTIGTTSITTGTTSATTGTTSTTTGTTSTTAGTTSTATGSTSNSAGTTSTATGPTSNTAGTTSTTTGTTSNTTGSASTATGATSDTTGTTSTTAAPG